MTDTPDTVLCRNLKGEMIPIPRDQVRFRPSVYGILIEDGNILLVSMRSTGKYFFPGGGLEIGETNKETLEREFLEETGIAVEVTDLIYFKEYFFYYDVSGNAYHGLMFFYRCRALSHNLVADEDVQDGEVEKPRWIPLDNLKRKDLFAHAEVLFDIAGISPGQ